MLVDPRVPSCSLFPSPKCINMDTTSIHECSIQWQGRETPLLGNRSRAENCRVLLGRCMWGFPRRVVPQITHFNRNFHYKPSILGYPNFWKHPYWLYRNKRCIKLYIRPKPCNSGKVSKTIFLRGCHYLLKNPLLLYSVWADPSCICIYIYIHIYIYIYMYI